MLAWVVFTCNWIIRNRVSFDGDTELRAHWAATDTGASAVRSRGAGAMESVTTSLGENMNDLVPRT